MHTADLKWVSYPPAFPKHSPQGCSQSSLCPACIYTWDCPDPLHQPFWTSWGLHRPTFQACQHPSGWHPFPPQCWLFPIVCYQWQTFCLSCSLSSSVVALPRGCLCIYRGWTYHSRAHLRHVRALLPRGGIMMPGSCSLTGTPLAHWKDSLLRHRPTAKCLAEKGINPQFTLKFHFDFQLIGNCDRRLSLRIKHSLNWQSLFSFLSAIPHR